MPHKTISENYAIKVYKFVGNFSVQENIAHCGFYAVIFFLGIALMVDWKTRKQPIGLVVVMISQLINLKTIENLIQ